MSDPLTAHAIHPHLMSYVCTEVFNRERPVLLVARDHDGDWQLLCGDEHEGDDYAEVVGVAHPLGDDPTLAEVLDLRPGEEAERSTVGGSWTRSAYGGED